MQRLRLIATAFVLAFLVVGCAWTGIGTGLVPARPLFSSVYDGADVLGTMSELQVGSAVRAAEAELGGDVAVVTVKRATTFGERTVSDLAGRWFDAWRLGGTLGTLPSRGKGVLLLVAVEDREARIELGRGFGGGASSRAQRVMQDEIVPRMKRGDVEGAVEAGARGLASLEPRPQTPGFLDTATRGLRRSSAFGPAGFFGGALIGVVLFGLGIWRGWRVVVGLGVAVFVVAVFTNVAILALFVLLMAASLSSRGGGRRVGTPTKERVWASGRGASGRW